MPRPDFNIRTLGKILSGLESQGKEVIDFNHTQNNIFQVILQDPSQLPAHYMGLFKLQGDQVICVEKSSGRK
jgi:hypothetical protein